MTRSTCEWHCALLYYMNGTMAVRASRQITTIVNLCHKICDGNLKHQIAIEPSPGTRCLLQRTRNVHVTLWYKMATRTTSARQSLPADWKRGSTSLPSFILSTAQSKLSPLTSRRCHGWETCRRQCLTSTSPRWHVTLPPIELVQALCS